MKKPLLNQFGQPFERHIAQNSYTNFSRDPFGQAKKGLVMHSIAQFHKDSYLTLCPQQLGELYVGIGLIKRIIREPVDDALSTHPTIVSNDIESGEIEEIEEKLQAIEAYKAIGDALIWARLYGGGAVGYDDGNDMSKEPEESNGLKNMLAYASCEIKRQQDYWLLGNSTYVHRKRMHAILNDEPPPNMRQYTLGWGFSELDSLDETFFDYLKFCENVMFASRKVFTDVVKIKGYADATEWLKQEARLLAAEFAAQSSVADTGFLDSEDDLISVARNLTGLADLWPIIKERLAGDTGLRKYQLFGESSAGFNNGENELDSYDMLLKSIQAQAEKPLAIAIKMIINKPDAKFRIEWPATKKASETEKIANKKAQSEMILNMFSSGLLSSKQTIEQINTMQLLPTELQNESPLG